ncbi:MULTISPECIES: hypothetical protein [Paenibacillus]|uniref:hypothetical protein n=1 Tax=Paenibacillus TaxID=44249 RepID=UPI0022B92698|nr:hypothetical protein [Paenibacillus caseinilyticus]MCZ8519636.1 hypothetical protein [Paenibacillus caseinilyticus]
MTLWQSFDKNEISLLIMDAGAYLLFFLLPKKFQAHISALSLVWGYAIGILFDFTIGGGLVDFYMVNDSNHLEGADFLYYLLFAPFGYFFFYFYETFRIHTKTFIPYVLAWAAVGVAVQWLFNLLDIITFQKGYKLIYSFPVFLITQTISGIYLERMKAREPILAPSKKKKSPKLVLKRRFE